MLDETTVSHFIPSVRLTGSREQKLRKLDTLIRHLLNVRDVLAGDMSAAPSTVRTYGLARVTWRVFAGGLATGALIAFLIQAAIRWVL